MNATMTTPARASTFAAVTMFWTQRPELMPSRLIPMNNPTITTAIQRVHSGGHPAIRTLNSAAATPMAAIAAV